MAREFDKNILKKNFRVYSTEKCDFQILAKREFFNFSVYKINLKCYNGIMDNIKDIVKNNLINLRKEHKLTQVDLSKKIKYSDKAISRWENGDVLPDVEILGSICEIYGVPISYLFEEHHIIDNDKAQRGNRIAFEVLCICLVWTIITIAFVYLQIIQNINAFQVFIWGVPTSAIVVLRFNRKWERNRLVSFLAQTILCWSVLTSIYLSFLSLNLWLIYLIGIPLQACIIVASFVKFK